jgi:putative transposase
MKVSVSGFYEWQHGQANPSRGHLENRALTETITEIGTESRGSYGSPRIWPELRLGESISRKRVERVIGQAGIEGPYRRRRRHSTTRRNPHAVPSDDLIYRQFQVDRADRLLVADITEDPTREGKV